MQEAQASGNKAAQATDAIKATLDMVRDLCGENCSICAGAIGDSRIYNVLVPDKRGLDQIPAKLEVDPRPLKLYRWKYYKIYKGVEFYCYEQGGEE